MGEAMVMIIAQLIGLVASLIIKIGFVIVAGVFKCFGMSQLQNTQTGGNVSGNESEAENRIHYINTDLLDKLKQK